MATECEDDNLLDFEELIDQQKFTSSFNNEVPCIKEERRDHDEEDEFPKFLNNAKKRLAKIKMKSPDSQNTDIEKSFICEICGGSYRTRRNLLDHERSHTGEKPYRCSLCGKSFTQSGSLSLHKKIHTGEKPFSCKFCNKKFIQSGNAKEHMKTCTSNDAREKPFACTFCDKSFARKPHYMIHIKRHTKDKPHPCQYCEKTFVTRDNAKTHMKTCKAKGNLSENDIYPFQC